jgi:hypothetical protein
MNNLHDKNGVYDFVNLLLADGMARRYNLNRVAAVQRWARKAKAQTKCPKVFDVAVLVTRRKVQSKIAQMIDKMHNKLVEDGVI